MYFRTNVLSKLIESKIQSNYIEWYTQTLNSELVIII